MRHGKKTDPDMRHGKKKQQVVEAISRYEYDVPNSAAAVCCLLLDSMKPALVIFHPWQDCKKKCVKKVSL